MKQTPLTTVRETITELVGTDKCAVEAEWLGDERKRAGAGWWDAKGVYHQVTVTVQPAKRNADVLGPLEAAIRAFIAPKRKGGETR